MRGLALVFVAWLCSGCALTYFEVGVPVPDPAGLEIGRTTVTEVLELYGPPRLIRRQFDGELYSWRNTPQGRLAEIIVLDQFSRNNYRDTPMSFASDTLALVLAQEAISVKAEQSLNDNMRSFLYMPFMHSESEVIHTVATSLFKTQDNYNFELRHKEIIDRFGRYPHRNAILGRVSSSEEIEFLQQPGSSF